MFNSLIVRPSWHWAPQGLYTSVGKVVLYIQALPPAYLTDPATDYANKVVDGT